MPRTTPRFIRSERRRDGRELLTPLPPILLERLADTKPLVEHQRVAERLVELGARLPQTQASLKLAMDEEAAAMRAAVRAGKQTPQRKVDRVAELREQLERTATEQETIEGLLAETAQALLEASLEHVRPALDEAEERREGMLDAAREALERAATLLEASGSVAAEGAWLGQLAVRGEVAPFGNRGGASTAPRGYLETRTALEALTHGRERQREVVEQAERERETADLVGVPGGVPRRLPLPPGSSTWVMPGSEAEPEPAAVAE